MYPVDGLTSAQLKVRAAIADRLYEIQQSLKHVNASVTSEALHDIVLGEVSKQLEAYVAPAAAQPPFIPASAKVQATTKGLLDGQSC